MQYGSTSISDEFAEYALNLAATNIVLLVGRCRRGRTEACTQSVEGCGSSSKKSNIKLWNRNIILSYNKAYTVDKVYTFVIMEV